MVAVGNAKNFNENPEIIGVKKSSNNIDELFAELFSLVNMENFTEKKSNLMSGDKTFEENSENLTGNLTENKNNSIELTKSLAEIFYKEIGIVDTDENEKIVDEINKNNSSKPQDINVSTLKLDLKKPEVEITKSKFKTPKVTGFEKNSLRQNSQENKLNLRHNNLKNLEKNNENYHRSPDTKKNHVIEITVKNLGKNLEKKIKNNNKVDLSDKNKLDTESPKKISTNTGSFRQKPTILAKEQMVEKKLLKKNKQTSKKIENFNNEQPIKRDSQFILKNNVSHRISTLKKTNKSVGENLRNLATDKNESKTSKNNFGSQSNFETQNTLDLMESSWGEKFAKIIKNNLNSQLNKINLKLNPKNLGKLSVEILVKDGSTQIQFNTETQEVANLLNENLGKLSELIDDKDNKLNNQSSNNGEKFSQQQEKKKPENFDKSISKKKVVDVNQSQNKNNHNIDVQA